MSGEKNKDTKKPHCLRCAGLDSAQGSCQKSWLYGVSAQAKFAG
jgi:hypothetical protein